MVVKMAKRYCLLVQVGFVADRFDDLQIQEHLRRLVIPKCYFESFVVLPLSNSFYFLYFFKI